MNENRATAVWIEEIANVTRTALINAKWDFVRKLRDEIEDYKNSVYYQGKNYSHLGNAHLLGGIPSGLFPILGEIFKAAGSPNAGHFFNGVGAITMPATKMATTYLEGNVDQTRNADLKETNMEVEETKQKKQTIDEIIRTVQEIASSMIRQTMQIG